MNVLVTGGAGFIGSNFIHYMLAKYPLMNIVNLDVLTYAGNPQNLSTLEGNSRHKFVHGSITNSELVSHVMDSYQIDAIVNFAAESHVDRSIVNPKAFFETNVQGTLALLEAAKEKQVRRFIQVSTDEVYGSLGDEGYFTEESKITPNSPYAASKASSDLLVSSYYKVFGLDVSITRCSNNYGPYQYPEKLVPLLITNGIDEKNLPIYGNGKNTRDWIHVKDHCAAIDLVLQKGGKGETYNIGSRTEKTNNEIVYYIMKKLNLPDNQLIYVADRPGHDYRYAVDPQKLEKELGWRPEYSFEEGMKETIEWYLTNESWWRPLLDNSHRELR
ncbi:dTDP-glucose 4,6-dehydratase [Bacillus mesophilum]|uniref:dTDP-glucose 4,6-dehydratase n=1 Tax=Bacillus mesophilum TaxID=1071718 RepID=A0A7V7RQ97_9BACI|nr:dTDP-glucose 4,6-dehydratase [Bacillus mesophilum]KAB2335581.1 dTDP-glucose 4,6-dehydratase [Bacillus mesophilum]